MCSDLTDNDITLYYFSRTKVQQNVHNLNFGRFVNKGKKPDWS